MSTSSRVTGTLAGAIVFVIAMVILFAATYPKDNDEFSIYVDSTVPLLTAIGLIPGVATYYIVRRRVNRRSEGKIYQAQEGHTEALRQELGLGPDDPIPGFGKFVTKEEAVLFKNFGSYLDVGEKAQAYLVGMAKGGIMVNQPCVGIVTDKAVHFVYTKNNFAPQPNAKHVVIPRSVAVHHKINIKVLAFDWVDPTDGQKREMVYMPQEPQGKYIHVKGMSYLQSTFQGMGKV